eukprot:COSAG06_NODE_6338_length_2973_cov_2.698506_4_plen_137_part_00
MTAARVAAAWAPIGSSSATRRTGWAAIMLLQRQPWRPRRPVMAPTSAPSVCARSVVPYMQHSTLALTACERALLEPFSKLTYVEAVAIEAAYRAQSAPPTGLVSLRVGTGKVERAHGLPVTSRTVVLWPRVSVSKA